MQCGKQAVLIKGPFSIGIGVSILYRCLPGVLGPVFPEVGEERGEDGFL